jgi:PST family polysaccharide transporter
MNLIGYSITDFFGRNSQRIVIGRFLGATILGYYQNALLICDNLIDLMVFSLHPLAVATLSKLHNERVEFRRSWAKALSSVTFFAMPVFAVLAVTGQDAVGLLLGKKWISAGILVTILALRGIPQSVDRTLGWLYVSSGRTDRWMHWGIFSMCAQLFAVLCGLPFGQIGVAIALVISAYILFFPGIYYAGKPMEIGVGDVMKVVGPQVVGSLAAATVGFALRYTVLAGCSSVVRSLLLTLVCSVTYFAIVVLFFRVRTPLRIVGSLVHEAVPLRFQRYVAWTLVTTPAGGQH